MSDDSTRSITFTATTDFLDVDAIKTLVTGISVATSYSGAALNGAAASAGTARPIPNSHTEISQYPLAYATGATAAYTSGSTIGFIGTYGVSGGNAVAVTRTATVVGTGGAASFIADGPVDTVTQVTVGAQASTSAGWTFGFTDLACKQRDGRKKPWKKIRGAATGVVAIVHPDGTENLLATATGECVGVDISRVRQSTTTAPFTLFE